MLNRLLKKDNRYFTIDKLKICFGSITVKEINKFEEFSSNNLWKKF